MNMLIIACCQLLAAVPHPWTPMTVSDGRVGVWGREYAFASNALPVGVTLMLQGQVGKREKGRLRAD